MNDPDYRKLAEMMLSTEREMRPLHRPPSTGIILSWRNELRVGMIQHPVDIRFPHVVLVSITSRYREPEYARHLRNLDPGRLELTADPRLDLNANFHVLRRIDKFLTFMTPEETDAMENFALPLYQLQPLADGRIEVTAIGRPEHKQEPAMPSEKVQ